MKKYLLLLALVPGCASSEEKGGPAPAPSSSVGGATPIAENGPVAFMKLDKGAFVERFRSGDIDRDVVVAALVEHDKSVYGKDDRVETMDESNKQRKSNADGVAALFTSGSLTRSADGKFFSLPATPLAVAKQLCTNEKFHDQPSGAGCSGFLVGRDLLATAGHCISSDNFESLRIVFGYRMVENGVVLKVPAEDVYTVKKIVERVFDSNDDYAIVQLNQVVPEAKASVLTLSSVDAKANDSVYVIGYPSGLPQKIAGGATVRNKPTASYFVANLDTFGGNSGSPIFNASHKVVGILIRGETDYHWDDRASCYRSVSCPNTGCSGEHVLHVSRFRKSMP